MNDSPITYTWQDADRTTIRVDDPGADHPLFVPADPLNRDYREIAAAVYLGEIEIQAPPA